MQLCFISTLELRFYFMTNMKNIYLLIYITLLCQAQTITAEKYHFSRRIRIKEDNNLTVYVFETVLEKGLDHCIKKCKAKKTCKYINYHVLAHACFLIGTTGEENFIFGNRVEKKKGYIFGNKSEWNMEDYVQCENCNAHGVCSMQVSWENHMCENSGCPYPEMKTGVMLLGNQFSTGSRIRYKCKEWYDITYTKTATSSCLESGNWTATDFLCLPVYECYHWTNEDLAAMGSPITVAVQRERCKDDLGHIYTQGSNADYHGVNSGCWCIKRKTS